MTLGGFVLQWLSQPVRYKSFKDLLKQHNAEVPRFVNSQPINRQHESVRKLRLMVPRKHCVAHIYYPFLRELYPLDGVIRHNTLYGAYSKLPTPQPLYVQPHHWERLMSSFTSAQGVNRSQIGDLFQRIVNGMNKCDLELSTKELNSLIFLTNYDEHGLTKLRKRWASFKDKELDISTANIFLRYASSHCDYDFCKEILDRISGDGIKMDRMSYDIVLGILGKTGLLNDTTSLLKEALSKGMVFDISMMNTVVSVLVSNERLDDAERIVEILMQRASLTTPQYDQHKRRWYTHQVQYLDSLHLQKMDAPLYIPSPTVETFSPLLRYYASIRHLTPTKVVQYLQFMDACGCSIPLNLSKDIVTSLANHLTVLAPDDLRRILELIQRKTSTFDNALMTSMLSLIQHPMFDSKTVQDLETNWKLAMSHSVKPNVDVELLTQHSVRRMTGAL